MSFLAPPFHHPKGKTKKIHTKRTHRITGNGRPFLIPSMSVIYIYIEWRRETFIPNPKHISSMGTRVRKGIGYHPIFCQYIKHCKRQSPRIVIIPGPNKVASPKNWFL
jgi:hypothetical protein